MLDISTLQNRKVDELDYNDTIVLEELIYKDTEIRDISPIDVKIHLKRVTDFSYFMSLEISGKMTLPCSITLKDVIYPFHIKTDVKVGNDDLNEENFEDYVKINQNTIDIIPIIWQNIVLEIPLKVVSDDLSDTTTSGDGWKLIRE